MIRKILLPLALALLSLTARGQALPDFTDLVERQGAAVVNISTTQTIRGNRFSQQLPFDENDPTFELFRRFFPQQPGVPQQEFQSKSLGSGFIVSAEGHILTNAHVVAGADEVLVRLTDKREFKAKVLGTDKRTDIALIKIDATGLPVVKLGDPNKLKLETRVNGEVRQSWNTDDFIFNCQQMIAYISRLWTLEPGDIIFTGTPQGVIAGKPKEQQVWLKAGDEIVSAIEKLGELKFKLA